MISWPCREVVMRRRIFAAGLAAGMIAGLPGTGHAQVPEPVETAPAVGAQAATSPPPPPAAAPKPTNYTVPAGTKVLLALKSGINTRTARPGDGVYLVSTFPVVVDRRMLIPSGVYVQGVVDRVKRPGRVKGRAQIDMHFTTMIFPNGQVVAIPGVVNSLPGSDGAQVKDSEGTVEQAGNKGRDVGNVLKGGAIGAEGGVIGGAATGNLVKGIGYGSLAGAAAGAIYTLFTRGNEITIASGTSVEMVMLRPLALEPAQLAGIGDTPGQPQLVPAAQPQPMKRPSQHLVCPPGGVGCN
jgi:hypothetical protein